MLSNGKDWLRRSLARAARERHYTLVPDWELSDLPLVNHLRLLFRRYDINCVIDVGGNKGQFASLLRSRVGFSGRIITFEPVSAYVKHLREMAARDCNWEVVACALGSEVGELEINVTRSPGLNSFLVPTNTGVENFWREGDVIGVERVPVRTLDEVVETSNVPLSNVGTYLKLDTQGYDLKVLSGAVESLPLLRGFQTEASVRAIYEGMQSYLETLQFIQSHGFSLSAMFPVTCDEDLRLIEFDCVAVNGRFEMAV